MSARGFKSFGTEWSKVLLGSQHLVGIVGPNGSGKSNLLEAVLFAAGCPASAMRAKTLRELTTSDDLNTVCYQLPLLYIANKSVCTGRSNLTL